MRWLGEGKKGMIGLKQLEKPVHYLENTKTLINFIY